MMSFESIAQIDFPHFLVMLFSLGVGVILFLVIINRLLGRLQGGVIKTSVFLLCFSILVAGGLVYGYLSGPTRWVWVPMVILGGIVLGEIHRLVLRRKYRSTRPVEQLGPTPDLLHPVTTTDLLLLHYEVRMPVWGASRLRVAYLSDLHVNDTIPLDYYLQVVDTINQTAPDLIFIGGDFVTELQFVSLLPEILAPLRSRLGVFAVLGNHDYWAGAAEIAAVVRGSGVRLLYNGFFRMQVEDIGSILLTGCEDYWASDRWSPPPTGEDDLTLALAHSGDNIYRLSNAGVDAVFSGHYHAGQIRLPYLGALILPSSYGRRFDQGHFEVDGTHLFVSAGVGAAQPKLRIYCPPDALIVDFI